MKEILTVAHKFVKQRKGLEEYSTVSRSLLRAEHEIDESWEALDAEDKEALKLEIMDVIMFMANALLALGVTEEEGSQLLKTKHSMNEARYDEAHFEPIGSLVAGKIYTVQDAIDRSRHYAKIGIPEGNDIF